MKGKRVVVTTLILVAVFLLLNVAARILQAPNRIDLKGEHEFLLRTSWHQVGEYARFIPVDDDAGCWATAIAQISHFHRLNPTGWIDYRTSGGHQVSFDLGGYEFRHDHFVSQIDYLTTVWSKEQVAKYIYFIAALIYTNFGTHQYLEHNTFVERFENHLGCWVEFYEYDKESYLRDRANIKSLLRREIESGRPIMFYFDNGKDFGHAAVIDGCVEMDGFFLVHLNMGWSGRHDGWYDPFDKIVGVRDDPQTRFLVAFAPRKTTGASGEISG